MPSDVTLFFRIVFGQCRGSLVLEDGGCIGEVNLMFSQVRPCLALIPLEPHRPAHDAQVYINAAARPNGVGQSAQFTGVTCEKTVSTVLSVFELLST